MRQWLTLVVMISVSQVAQADGQALHDKACLQCHASLVGGNGQAMYTRSDRKVQSYAQLSQQVSRCMVAADVQWQASQQRAVVDYLARRFYSF